jgi:hypothetical protein
MAAGTGLAWGGLLYPGIHPQQDQPSKQLG